MILLISRINEPNVDAVIQKLEKRHAKYVRFNTEDFPLSSFIGLKPGGDKRNAYLEVSGERIPLHEIKTVWFRRIGPHQLSPGLTPEENEVVNGECQMAMRALWSTLNCFWVNDPWKQRICDDKALQLQVAKDIGFVIPKTLITNNPADVREFFVRCNARVAFKTLGQPELRPRGPDPKGRLRSQFVFTNILTKEHLSRLDALKGAPMIFQEYIPKKFELRITIVGHDIFAAEIHSQDSPQENSRIDWRHYDFEHTPYKPHRLPRKIRNQLFRFMQAFGIVFGCIDMIVTPNDEYVFLEINTHGQYGWIEGILNYPINETIANLLIRGRSEK